MPADPSLPLQKAIRALLLDSDDVTALVPADNVLDVSGRPERSPCVIIGEGQTVFRRFTATAYADLHVWVQEPGLTGCKAIADAIVDALSFDPQDGVLQLEGFVCHELSVNQTRFVRDPHGPYAHGIVSLAGIVKAT